MVFDDALSPGDAARVSLALARLAAHAGRGFALTGGVAIEARLIGRTGGRSNRPFNDLDVIVESFDAVPVSLADAFYFRHVHSKAPSGRMLVQLVDPETALRIDVFRTCGATMARCEPITVDTISLRIVSVEDLAARAATLVLDLGRGQPVPRKHAQDLERLVGAVESDRVEIAWRDHRKWDDPPTFQAASARVAELVQARGNLLVVPQYSQDVDAICPKCDDTGRFRLAPATRIQSLLGYC